MRWCFAAPAVKDKLPDLLASRKRQSGKPDSLRASLDSAYEKENIRAARAHSQHSASSPADDDWGHSPASGRASFSRWGRQLLDFVLSVARC